MNNVKLLQVMLYEIIHVFAKLLANVATRGY